MGPVDGSVRAEGISSKNAMEREALSANANENSGEAYHNLNGPSLSKENVKHMSEDSCGHEVGRENTLEGTLEVDNGLNISRAESKYDKSSEEQICVDNSGGMTYELGRVANAEDTSEDFHLIGVARTTILLELRKMTALLKHFGFDWKCNYYGRLV